MKKSILIIAMIAVIMAMGQSCRTHKVPKQVEEEPALCGGYGNEREPNEHDIEVFEHVAQNDIRLADLRPVVVGSQVVAGMNYRFTCYDSNGKTVIVTIFVPLPGEGEPVITNIL